METVRHTLEVKGLNKFARPSKIRAAIKTCSVRRFGTRTDPTTGNWNFTIASNTIFGAKNSSTLTWGLASAKQLASWDLAHTSSMWKPVGIRIGRNFSAASTEFASSALPKIQSPSNSSSSFLLQTPLSKMNSTSYSSALSMKISRAT